MSFRVLIIEDDAVLADGMSGVLRASGYSVHCITDGVHAYEALKTESYNLAILDLGLPRMDGLELLRRLRAQGKYTPVLVVSARDAVSERVTGLKSGADDYLTKPFDLAEFEARVLALARRNPEQQRKNFVSGGLVLDIAGRSVTFNGESIALTPREYSILEAMMASTGKPVSREQLQNLVALADEDLSDNVFQVNISRLRKKLEVTGMSIRQIRGFGYLLQHAAPATGRD